MGRSRGVYNRIYTEEKWEQVNQENKNIMDDFLTEYRQQKKPSLLFMLISKI